MCQPHIIALNDLSYSLCRLAAQAAVTNSVRLQLITAEVPVSGEAAVSVETLVSGLASECQ